MKKFGKRSWCLALGACCLVACVDDTVFSKYVAIENRIWNKDSEYFFTFTVTDNAVPYDISVKLRNNDMYPFKNLWLFCSMELADSSLTRDTLEVMLADDFGKWTGSGISIFQNEFPLYRNFHFPDTGQYTAVFRQGMRADNLKGIENIGLTVRKAK
ncbi:MAG: gliding motility lipoprotein GldH [Tannerella sp.]|jgi:gliding motility-associated lipoprotein GldH|nr:gliding motility lipoprotein GldH [Tannerella sp.]